MPLTRFSWIHAVTICAILVLATQIYSGCYHAEFGDDEASHYLSGLMIHDYLLGGLDRNPIRYLQWYHSHYPLIGIGHWGPAFYLLEALWMTLFSSGRASVLALSALLTIATAGLIYRYGTARMKLTPTASLFAAAGFSICSIVQGGSSAVMLDIPITLCCLLALYSYQRFVDSGQWGDSLRFAAIAAIAMLIKGNGALLALLPPLMVALSGKWSLLRRAAFWAPLPFCIVFVAPWYAVTYANVAAGFRFGWGLSYSVMAMRENAALLLTSLGPLPIVLALAGIFAGARRTAPGRSGRDGALALLLAAWLFQSLVPAAIQDRYLAPLLPPLLLLAALGGQALIAFWPHPMTSARQAGVFALAIISLLPAALSDRDKPQTGMRNLAKSVWRMRSAENPVVLIVTPESVESAAIAELAMQDPARPSLFAVRGSRLLGGGGYNRSDYQPKFSDPADVRMAIDAAEIPMLLIQADPGGWLHVAQVDGSLVAFPRRLIAAAGPAALPIRLYDLPDATGKSADIPYLLALSAPRGLQ